ncbi:MAG: Crp/Fnr family transcriptional regulator [Sediminibacterium sp.]|nr:Crp/Fnr family transcriptional regulator [Chitinophagaceae bacterium]MCA6447179.1 Crp/Fnr family transcriptional regulator [Chitinophagaceae bacterium]
MPHLTEAEWQALEERLTIKIYIKGDHIVKQGEVCNQVYFINSGFLRFYKIIDGKEISTGFMGANQYVSSYDSFLTRKPAFENLQALEDAELHCLSYDDMQFLYKQYPVYQMFGRVIAEQLFIWVNERTNALLLLSPEQRYENMINNQSEVLQRVPQYMLASYIGVTPEHLSRIRKKMMGR